MWLIMHVLYGQNSLSVRARCQSSSSVRFCNVAFFHTSGGFGNTGRAPDSYLRVYTPAARLQSSRVTIYLHPPMSAGRFWSSRVTCLYASTSLHLQCAPSSPCLHGCTPVASLHSSIPPFPHSCCLHIATSPLQRSMPQCLHVYTPAARLQNSKAPYLLPPRRRYTYSAPPDLYASMPPCRYTCSGSLELYISIPLRCYTYSAPPELHIIQSIHYDNNCSCLTSNSASHNCSASPIINPRAEQHELVSIITDRAVFVCAACGFNSLRLQYNGRNS